MYRAGGCPWLRERAPIPGGAPTPPAPRPLRPGFALPARGLHLRFSLFALERDETTKTRENNKTLQCEVNGAVRSVGRAGQGRRKRVRWDWRRGPKVGRPRLGGSCSPGAAARLGRRAELRGRAAPARAAGWAGRRRAAASPRAPSASASQAGGRAPSAGRQPLSASPATPRPASRSQSGAPQWNCTPFQSLWVGGADKMGAPCSLFPFGGGVWPWSPIYRGP